MATNTSTSTNEGVDQSKKNMDPKTQDVTLYVSDMLSEMEEDFRKSGDSIMERMRKMGSKMDGLEQSISDLMQDAGLDDDDEDDDDEEARGGSPPRLAPSNSSPSRKTDGVSL
eukprot:CAMPEP_0201117674 /NCGR_PEP_ID=MMETSP0850-20130426/1683_1 /ASSEMBLY_ACC=CAM_ASM_000622 /TAXON_ID=183588 /ORGANISM="Pseudo-nitzschia fraudulenta, Strain WWA7" /LENGTH=112 /DNA_ID=CAMNT_0047382191 /DNA_START=257 /DNA_END=595 /DNA_ORIENTATION=+